MNISVALLAGMIAGLALAAPLGAIGVLLVHEGVTRGFRRGVPGAVAVATVDTLYCAAAIAAGSVLGPIVAGWAPWPRIVGGMALVWLGVHGILRSRRSQVRAVGAEPAVGTSRGRFALFLGLTALNPATLVYFVAIIPGLEQIALSTMTRVGFVVGVGIASLGWQALLVALGAGLRRKATPSFRRWTAMIGNGVVVALGLLLLAQAW